MNLNITPEYDFQTFKKDIVIQETGISGILENLSLDTKINSIARCRIESGISNEIKPKIAGINREIDDLETSISLISLEDSTESKVQKYLSSTRHLAVLRVASENLISSEEIEWDSASWQKEYSVILKR